MRLKFRKVPALLLSAAMAVTPMTGAWAEEAAGDSAYQWVNELSAGTFYYDAENHTATVSYTLYKLEDGEVVDFKESEKYPAVWNGIDATCEENAFEYFTYAVDLTENGVSEHHYLKSEPYEIPETALGHDLGDWEFAETLADATCYQPGMALWKKYCSRCDYFEAEERPTEKLSHGDHEHGYGDMVEFVGYVPDTNVVEPDEYKKITVYDENSNPFEVSYVEEEPEQDRPEKGYSYYELYVCDYNALCGYYDYVKVERPATAVLQSDPQIDAETIENLYYAEIDGEIRLVEYPAKMSMVSKDSEGNYTGKIKGTETNNVTTDPEKPRLVDCGEAGYYRTVTYALNDDHSYKLDENGERIIVNVVEEHPVKAGHQMDDPVYTGKAYRCELGKDGKYYPTTCQDGWYETASYCKNPNCEKHEKPDTEKVTVKGDERLHQFPKWDQTGRANVVINTGDQKIDQKIDQQYLVLNTENCENGGIQTYVRHCALCGAEDEPKVVDNTKLKKNADKIHKFGTPEFAGWIEEPTCTEPGAYHSHAACMNEWQNEDGTTYVCGHERETDVIVEALGHDTVTEFEWIGSLVVDFYSVMLNDFNDNGEAKYLGYNPELQCFAKAAFVDVCSRCGKRISETQDGIEVTVVAIEKENETSCAPGHITLRASWYDEEGNKYTEDHECVYYSSMTAYLGKTDHAWGAPFTVVEKDATCTEDGKKVTKKVCELCGTEQIISETVIPATGHVAGEVKVEDGNVVTYCKVCGEPYITVPVEPEDDPVADFVARMYDVVLNRKGDEEGAAYWTQRLKDGNQSGAGLAADFFTGKEYIGRNKSDSEYLNDLYTAIMGRNADAAGKAYWQGRLNMGYSRNSVLESFLGSPEFRGICDEYGIKVGSYKSNEASDVQLKNVTAFVTRLYETCMGRPADPTGLDYWVKRLVNGQATGTDAVVYFCNSAEFAAKNLSDSEFVTVLYTAVMGRNAEESGVNYWAGQLAKGATRTSVVESFAKSAEFGRICESYGITR